MSKKHKAHEEHMDESWLIPYADLLTLLLALFIVLFASSNVESSKYEAVMKGLYEAFNGVLPAKDGVLPGEGETLDGEGGGNPDEYVPTPTEDLSEKTEEEIKEIKKEQLKDLTSSFKEYIEKNNLENDMVLEKQDNGISITLRGDVFFQLGRAELTAEHKITATEISNMIVTNEKGKFPFEVVISGHTDNIPISNSQYRSNWHLSVERAVNFVEAMLNNQDLKASQCSAKGRGEYEPIDTNDTAEGRTHNRRVEVYIYFPVQQEE